MNEALAEAIRRELVCACVEEDGGPTHPFCRGAELAARLAETAAPIATHWCGQTQPHAAHEWIAPPAYGTATFVQTYQCGGHTFPPAKTSLSGRVRQRGIEPIGTDLDIETGRRVTPAVEKDTRERMAKAWDEGLAVGAWTTTAAPTRENPYRTEGES